MEPLADRTCLPVIAGEPRLLAAERLALAEQLGPSWTTIGDCLRRRFAVADFAAAVEFNRAIGAIADGNHHHPELVVTWGQVIVTLSTHDVDGLSPRDFIVAAKIDRAYAAFA
jgi:4a-hydroxytetrahydrobiopterin dehydratase